VKPTGDNKLAGGLEDPLSKMCGRIASSKCNIKNCEDLESYISTTDSQQDGKAPSSFLFLPLISKHQR